MACHKSKEQTKLDSYYCEYCGITLKLSYKSKHEGTRKHRGAYQASPAVKIAREQRKAAMEKRTDDLVALMTRLGIDKLTARERRFIAENESTFMDCIKFGLEVDQ
jgi:hypothetical protein